MATSDQLQDLVTQWRQRIQNLYPDRHKRVYTLPFVHFRRVPFVLSCFAGQPVLIAHSTSPLLPSENENKVSLKKSQTDLCGMWAPLTPHVKFPVVCDSDLKDDAAQQGVLKCLQEFGQEHGEAMFIISQLNFTDYLNKPCYASAAEHLKYPRPEDLGPRFRRGEFDILLIHRRHGLVIGEIKSVGSNAVALNKTPDEMVADVAKKAERAARQLERSKKVLRYLLSDLAPDIAVKATLIVPYVTRENLRRVLEENQQLHEDLSRCLGDAQTTDVSKVVELCLCADDLAANDDGPWQTSQLKEWWTRRVVEKEDTSGTSQGMSEQLYDDILARFAGPATTVTVHCTQRPRVEIRTLGEAVSELGERLSRLVVTPEQIRLLTSGVPRMLINGPPGTGKSLILVLIALTWLRQGKDVFVVSLKPGSLAISRLIHRQLQMTLEAEGSRLQKYGVPRLVEYDLFHDPSCEHDCVSTLSSAALDKDIGIIVDEYGSTVEKILHLYNHIARELLFRVPGLHLWAASVGNVSVPEGIQSETLTVPLRCAPSVLEEVSKGVNVSSGICGYSTDAVPSPFDGPNIIRLHHCSSSHLVRWPLDCEQCGHNIAAELKILGVGIPEPCSVVCTGSAQSSIELSSCKTVAPPRLQYRDVFVLANSTRVHDDVRDEAGQVTSRANGVIRGLRAAGIPTCAVQSVESTCSTWRKEVLDAALAINDKVTVADRVDVGGLERKIVVWLSGRKEVFDDKYTERHLLIRGQVFAMSRCTSQLIVVEVSGP